MRLVTSALFHSSVTRYSHQEAVSTLRKTGMELNFPAIPGVWMGKFLAFRGIEKNGIAASSNSSEWNWSGKGLPIRQHSYCRVRWPHFDGVGMGLLLPSAVAAFRWGRNVKTPTTWSMSAHQRKFYGRNHSVALHYGVSRFTCVEFWSELHNLFLSVVVGYH